MKLTCVVFALTLCAPLVAAADVTITDNDKTVAVDCAKDANITVAGNNNKVTATGACKQITIAGNKNNVTSASTEKVSLPGNDNTAALALVDALSVMGNRNQVTYGKPVGKAKRTSVSNLGTDNKVSGDEKK